MSEYVPMSEDVIKNSSIVFLQQKLHEAQGEIERLTEKGKLCTPAERGRMIEQRVIKDLSDRMETAERVISTTAADSNRRLRILEAPPKDLSDPYPKDGPNVRNANAHASLSEWLMKVDKRVTALGGELSVHKQAAQVEGVSSDSERLDLHIQVQLLESRVTALSETVAKNRKHLDALIENVTDMSRQLGTSWNRRVDKRRVGPDEKRNLETRMYRISDSEYQLGRRSGPDRRQP